MSPIVCLLFMCLLVTVQAVPTPSTYCTNDSQCDCNECCYIPSIIVSKKRADAADSLTKVATGTCQRYKKQGEDCSPPSGCGCAPGLTCHFKPDLTEVKADAELADPSPAKRLVIYQPGTYTCKLA